MKNNKIAMESLVMDLMRVAIGYHRNSVTMASRFLDEALKRKNEINPSLEKPYIQKILSKIDTLKNYDKEKLAEYALTYSIILQNYTKMYHNP